MNYAMESSTVLQDGFRIIKIQ